MQALLVAWSTVLKQRLANVVHTNTTWQQLSLEINSVQVRHVGKASYWVVCNLPVSSSAFSWHASASWRVNGIEAISTLICLMPHACCHSESTSASVASLTFTLCTCLPACMLKPFPHRYSLAHIGNVLAASSYPLLGCTMPPSFV